MALIPVCKGSFTGCLKITPGAFLSSGISYNLPSIGPFPSIGLPKVPITLPHKPSPTCTDAMVLVRFTVSPSFISLESPNSTAPTLSSSRFRIRAFNPFSNSSSSPACALDNPYIRATPSPTWRTIPISSSSALVLKLESCSRKIAETSSGLTSAIIS